MKFLFSAFFFISIININSVCSQIIACSDEDVENRIKRFLNTTTLVVLEDEKDSYYNVVVSNAMYKYWKINNYKLVSIAESKNFINNEKYSFLALGYFNDDALALKKSNNYGLNLSLVEPLAVNIVSYSFSKDSVALYNQMYRIISVIQMMHEYVGFHKRKFEKADKNLPSSLLEFYNSRRIELDDKRVVVNKSDLTKFYASDKTTNLLTLEGIEKNFKVKPEIVSAEKLAKIILKQDPKIVFIDGYGNYTNMVTAKGGRVIATGKGYVPNYSKKIIKSAFLATLIGISTFLILH